MRLIQSPIGKIVRTDQLFRRSKQDIIDIAQLDLLTLISAVFAVVKLHHFSRAMTSLNPLYTIGDQIAENVLVHMALGKKEAKDRALEMLTRVQINSPKQRLDEYPHQLSGGMRQRVMIAMALSCNPSILIADEPTTALDVTVQAQILDLMRKLQEEFKSSIILITHNLGVVSQMAAVVAVMYLGKIVEYAETRDLFHHPLHPYTVGLLNSIPVLGRKDKLLVPIVGMVPTPTDTFQDVPARVVLRR
jgi:ABC-type dipeptide/oligopeptide/nickel transport system ATPase component